MILCKFYDKYGEVGRKFNGELIVDGNDYISLANSKR